VIAGEITLHRRVEQLEDAFAGGHCGLQDVVFFAEVHDGTEESQSVLDEGDQHTQANANRGDKVGVAIKFFPVENSRPRWSQEFFAPSHPRPRTR